MIIGPAGRLCPWLLNSEVGLWLREVGTKLRMIQDQVGFKDAL